MTAPAHATAFAALPPGGAGSGLGRSGAGTTPILQDQHVLILGLGASGLAMARWCAGRGARVMVADTRSDPPQLPALQRELPAARFVSGAFDAALLQGADVRAVFKSPGLAPREVASIAAAARAQGLVLSGELALFSQALAELGAERGYRPKVLAITGTNGKTTVTSLTAQLVERAGKTVAVAGNIGPTLLDTLSQRLSAATLPEVWVLELSSFQLDGETGFEPSAATVLNVTQDHLDWHEDMAAYTRAKANIFGRRGLLVLNREDPLVMAMLTPQLKPKRSTATERPHVTFGADSPRRPGDFGLEQAGGLLWLVRAQGGGEARGKSPRPAPEHDLHLQRLMPTDALRIRGRHNAVNALAALALGSAAGCAIGPMLRGLREYRGEPHRMQSIGALGDVEFFDDSKGTNVGATVAALCGLGAERRVVVIMGGQGKGQDFSPLAPAVARHARAVVLIGRDAPLLRAALEDSGVALIDVATLEQAVTQATALAQPGDAVLMSPACASYDMFDDYEHRARVFAAAVQAQARLAGVGLEEHP